MSRNALSGERCVTTQKTAAKETTKREEKKENYMFPLGPVIVCFTSLLKKLRKPHKNICYTLTGTKICRGFNVHALITWESKVQVVSPGSLRVLNHGTWHVLLQLDKVFELIGTTKYQSDCNTNKSEKRKLAFSSFTRDSSGMSSFRNEVAFYHFSVKLIEVLNHKLTEKSLHFSNFAIFKTFMVRKTA